jgi:hypothetical protein
MPAHNVVASDTRPVESCHILNVKRQRVRKLIGMMEMAGGVAVLLAFPTEIICSATPVIKVPGPYPYETPVQVPVPPPVSDSSRLPTPAPFPYPDSSPPLPAAQDRDSRTAKSRRPLTAKAVREAAFKYNGVPKFCGFLAALPADVSVFDPKLGTTRTLVKAGHVVQQNAAWLTKRK